MNLETLKELINSFGVPVVMLMVFIYIDLKRRKTDEKDKERLTERLQKTEDWQKDELQKLITDNTLALQDHANASQSMIVASKDSVVHLRQMTQVLKTRPCIKGDLDNLNEAS